MELGATVCTVKSPDCSACPVKASCLAHKLTAAGPGGTKGLKLEPISTDDSASTGATKAPQSMPALASPSRSRASQGEAQAKASDAFRDSAKCGCDVCEAGDDGMAVLPVAVTDYPRKAAKT